MVSHKRDATRLQNKSSRPLPAGRLLRCDDQAGISNRGATTEARVRPSLFYLPTLGRRAAIEARLARKRCELYQRMLHEISARKRLADGCRLRQVSLPNTSR